MLSYLNMENQGRSGAALNLEGMRQPELSGAQAYAASCDATDTADGTYLRSPHIEVTPA